MTARHPKRPGKTPSSQESSSGKPLPFLLEIGTEELPSTFLPIALQELERIGHGLFTENRLEYRGLRTVGTPRRLTLLVEAVEPKQAALIHEIYGPPRSAAFDSSGKPTKAAEGFAKSQNVSVEALVVKETPKGPYVCVEKHQKGQRSKAVLAEAFPHALAKLSFPKSMRWNASRVRFARPIRWLVAMLGGERVGFEFAGIRAGVQSSGHRFYGGKPRSGTKFLAKVSDASDYVSIMKHMGVVVDPRERRQIIQEQVSRLAQEAGGAVDPDTCEELIQQAVCGVESPGAILGGFHPEFLSVPKPVLISSMKEHQGFFSLVAGDGRLLPKFIAVTNMPWGDVKLMTKGNERVLAARLKDAQHFFKEDLKRPLPDRLVDLEQVVFHQKLGTLRHKIERMRALSGCLTEHLGRSDLQEVCQRAALLAKADLTTGMVGEFPNLQGVMGEEYARYAGEAPAVCQAIGSHYSPRFPDDPLPDSLPGVLVALADRCDSIVAFFSVGMIPSGSEDPLGLRRAAYGVVRLVTETPLRLNLIRVVTYALDQLEKQGVSPTNDRTIEESVGFIVDRLRFLGKQTFGLQEDVMEAVTSVRDTDCCDLYDLLMRMTALQAMMKQADFEPLMTGFKRAHRIVEKEQWSETSIQEDIFTHECERVLLKTLGQAQQAVQESVEEQRYEKALQSLLTLKTPIDQFFASVLVNDENPAIRANRLSLLRVVDRLFLQLADFSYIQSGG